MAVLISTILLWGEIGRQHGKAPLAAVLSPYFNLTHPPNPQEISDRDRAPHQGLRPLLFSNSLLVL